MSDKRITLNEFARMSGAEKSKNVQNLSPEDRKHAYSCDIPKAIVVESKDKTKVKPEKRITLDEFAAMTGKEKSENYKYLAPEDKRKAKSCDIPFFVRVEEKEKS